MAVIVRLNNNPVNDMTAPVSWLINYLDKAIKTKSTYTYILTYLLYLLIILTYYTYIQHYIQQH